MSEQVPSKELDYPPKFSEYEAEWSKRGYEPHIATLLAKADWSEDMINWQEDEINRLHNEIEAGGSRERGTSPNRSCGTAGQSGPASSLHDWSLAPADATHYQPHQRAYYKRISATEWLVWSRLEREQQSWMESPGTNDSADWIKRPTAEPGPTLNDAIRCIDYADCMLAQSGYTEDSTTRMRLANARAIISGASQPPNDGWSALCEAVAKADPVNYRSPTPEPSARHRESAVLALELVDRLLAEAGYEPDSSARHNLAIGVSCIRSSQPPASPGTGAYCSTCNQMLADSAQPPPVDDTGMLIDLLEQCRDFLYDDSGSPIAPMELRERVRVALTRHTLTKCEGQS